MAPGAEIAALNALGQLDLLRGRQQRYPADVLEEDLQRVCRELSSPRSRGRRLVSLVISLVDDVDLKLVKTLVELVGLGRARGSSSSTTPTSACVR